MGPYGLVGADIKTGRSPMAQDHFKTPSWPQKGPWNDQKSEEKSKKSSRVGQGPKWGRGIFVMNFANILGMMDFDFEKSFFYFASSQVSQISKFPGRASSILLPSAQRMVKDTTDALRKQ